MNQESEEDEFGHIWGIGWMDTEKPHPGFGGSTNIYGCYVSQCEKCGMYFHEQTDYPCGPKIRE